MLIIDGWMHTQNIMLSVCVQTEGGGRVYTQGLRFPPL